MSTQPKAPKNPCGPGCREMSQGDCPGELWACKDYKFYRQQITSGDEQFKKGDTVWYEPTEPIKARDPRQAMQAGWLGQVRYDTGQALFLRLTEERQEVGQLVQIQELRRRILPS